MKTLPLPSVDKRVEEIAKDPDGYVRRIRDERAQRGLRGAWLNDASPTPPTPAQKRRMIRKLRANRSRPKT